MFTLLKKEINLFLNSLIGYIVIGVFLLITGLFLWVIPEQFNILDFGYANVDGLFILAPWVFLFLIPAITMRSFAEERKSGTIEILLTKPLTELQIIMAKFLGSFVIVIIALLPTWIYFITVYQFGFPEGNLDIGGFLGSYLGLLFLASAFCAVGLFTSSLTDNQIVSFILSLFICGFLFIGFESISSLNLLGKVDLLISSLGIKQHYVSMSRGVIDTRDVIYFMSVDVLFIMATKLRLERK